MKEFIPEFDGLFLVESGDGIASIIHDPVLHVVRVTGLPEGLWKKLAPGDLVPIIDPSIRHYSSKHPVGNPDLSTTTV